MHTVRFACYVGMKCDVTLHDFQRSLIASISCHHAHNKIAHAIVLHSAHNCRRNLDAFLSQQEREICCLHFAALFLFARPLMLSIRTLRDCALLGHFVRPHET